MQCVKLVAVGDTGVGKSSVLYAAATHKTPDIKPPSVLENSCIVTNVDGRDINVGLWDTLATAEYERLRPLSYPRTDVFLICFSVDSKESFSRAESFWLPELSYHCPNVPILLVATKVDLRESNKDSSLVKISPTEGRSMAESLKLAGYCECSSLHLNSIDQVIVEAVRAVTRPPPRIPPRRSLLCDLI